MDIVQSGNYLRPHYHLAIVIVCTTLALISGTILIVAVLETDGFVAIKTAFCGAPLIDGVPRIANSAFRPRMIAMGVDGLIMAFVTWFLFGNRGRTTGRPLSRQEVLESLALFTLCGIALMSFVMSCFLKVPLLESACSLHAKEGFIDTLHPIAFGTAAVLLATTALRGLRVSRSNRSVTVFLLIVAAASFVVAMEEISWGQTFFRWQTPESVAAWNYQNETNLHNAFNFVLGRAYLVAGIIGFLAVSASVYFRRRFPDHPITAILPATPMFWAALWLPAASQGGVYTDTEPFESIVAILALYYAVDQWRNETASSKKEDPLEAGRIL